MSVRRRQRRCTVCECCRPRLHAGRMSLGGIQADTGRGSDNSSTDAHATAQGLTSRAARTSMRLEAGSHGRSDEQRGGVESSQSSAQAALDWLDKTCQPESRGEVSCRCQRLRLRSRWSGDDNVLVHARLLLLSVPTSLSPQLSYRSPRPPGISMRYRRYR